MAELTDNQKQLKKDLKQHAKTFKKAFWAHRNSGQTSQQTLMQVRCKDLFGLQEDGSRVDEDHAVVVAELFHNDWRLLFTALSLIEDEQQRDHAATIVFDKVMNRRSWLLKLRSRPSKAILGEMGRCMQQILLEKNNGVEESDSKTQALYLKMLASNENFAYFVLKRASYFGDDTRDLEQRNCSSAHPNADIPPLVVHSLVDAGLVKVSALKKFRDQHKSVKKPFKWRLPYFIRSWFARPLKPPFQLVVAATKKAIPPSVPPRTTAPAASASSASSTAPDGSAATSEQQQTIAALTEGVTAQQQTIAALRESVIAQQQTIVALTQRVTALDAAQARMQSEFGSDTGNLERRMLVAAGAREDGLSPLPPSGTALSRDSDTAHEHHDALAATIYAASRVRIGAPHGGLFASRLQPATSPRREANASSIDSLPAVESPQSVVSPPDSPTSCLPTNSPTSVLG